MSVTYLTKHSKISKQYAMINDAPGANIKQRTFKQIKVISQQL